METKPWYTSKTIILNAVMGFLTAILPFVPAAGHYSLVIQNNMPVIGACWAILAIIVRFMTSGKVQLGE
jgi:hypothetical protein